MMSQLSLLMPTYNGATYLREQLDSILTQTYSDFELIIVDDGSKDETSNLLVRYAAQDSRIRLLPSEGNQGQNSRLVELIQASTGALIAFSDQDDIWHLDKLALLVAAVEERSLAFGPSALIDQDNNSLNSNLIDSIGSPTPSTDDKLTYLFRPIVSAHAMLVRRDRLSLTTFKRQHWFDQLIALDGAFSGGVAYVPDAITYHRLHATNQCNGGALAPRAWSRVLSPLSLPGAARSQRATRWRFVQRLEHLAYSEIVPRAIASDFQQLLKLCVPAWFDPTDTFDMSPARLAEALETILLPMRGSLTDGRLAQYFISELTRSPAHPRQLYRAGRQVVRELAG